MTDQKLNVPKIIIAFTGPAEHGKSTCARMTEEYLMSRLGRSKTVAFADVLKDVCKRMCRLTDTDVNTTAGKAAIQDHLGVSARTILQKFGTDVCRDVLPRVLAMDCIQSQSIWVWHIRCEIEQATQPIIVQDLRFPDEESMLRSYNAVVIRVIRPTHESGVPTHISETARVSCDYEITNSGTLDDLRRALYAILDSVTDSIINKGTSGKKEMTSYI